MKTLVTRQKSLIEEGRWDFDYHSPAELIKRFPPGIIRKIVEVGEIVKEKKDPTKEPEKQFEYIDISCIDVEVGEITRTQELTGEEAPSRARKLVRGYYIIISTCRPTRARASRPTVTGNTWRACSRRRSTWTASVPLSLR